MQLLFTANICWFTYDDYDVDDDDDDDGQHTASRCKISLCDVTCWPYLTLPYLRGGCQGTPALRPQFGPSAQPRQTSWSKKSLGGFWKPQENCPVDTIESVQWDLRSSNTCSQIIIVNTTKQATAFRLKAKNLAFISPGLLHNSNNSV